MERVYNKFCKRTITKDNFEIDKPERDITLQLPQNMIYTRSELHYDNLYQEFKSSVPKCDHPYFNENWHNNREDWVQCFVSKSLGNSTNNRTEGQNSAVQEVLDTENCIEDFIEKLFVFIES